MNIFILDDDPIQSATYHADKHISKMILESAQMLSTVLGGPYKPTHANHPCTLWTGRSRQNALWLWTLAMALNAEYRERYNKNVDHKSWSAIETLWKDFNRLPDDGLTPFAQAMPDQYKDPDPVKAYRAYYLSKPFVAWRNGAPGWAQ